MPAIATGQSCEGAARRQGRSAPRLGTLLAATCWLLAAAGCVSTADEDDRLTIIRELQKETRLVGTLPCDDLTISYYCPAGLEDQAKRIGELVARQLACVHEATGFESRWSRFSVFLKPVDRLDWKTPSKNPPPEFALNEIEYVILCVERGRTSYPDIITSNAPVFPRIYMHELVECSLLQLPGDPSKGEPCYTRWFREGFSEYAAFLAHKVMAGDSELAKKVPVGARQNWTRGDPYSCLAEVGRNLFTWRQHFEGPVYHDEGAKRGRGRPSELDHYSAALGLFLLIEDKSGQEAIKKFIISLNQQAYVDGVDLKRLVNRLLNADIVKIVEEFRFPALGMVTLPFGSGQGKDVDLSIEEGLWVRDIDPDGLAGRAGIQKGDAVISLDGKPTLTNFDFEQALYERRHQAKVEVGIWREGAGQKTVEIPLEPVAP